ncbi:MAG: hypothetical protein RLZZ324_483, partial [Candidatus Parcubacteria bacterium]
VTATALTTIFSVFVDLGLANVLVRETAKKKESATNLLGNVLGAKVVLAAAAALAVTIAARVLKYDAITLEMIAIATAVMVLDSIHLVFYAVIRGFQDLRYEAVGVVTGQFVTIVSGGIFIFALHLPLPFLIVALVMGSTWNVLWSSYALTRKFPVKIRVLFQAETLKYLALISAPFALAGIFTRVYSYLDTVMLSRLASSAVVGAYGVANKLTFAFQFLPMSFAAAVYPAMAEYHVTNREKLGILFVSSIRYLLVAVVPLCFGIAVLATPLVRTIYGAKFEGAVAPLQVLIFSLVFAFIYWPVGSLLNACDRQGRNTVMLGVTMGANALLNVFLIPRFGALGAAWAALLCNVVLFFGAVYAARGLAQYHAGSLLRSAVQIMFAGSFMGTSVFLLEPYLPLLVLIPVAAVVYLAVLVGIGGMRGDELKMLADFALRRGGKKISDIMA